MVELDSQNTQLVPSQREREREHQISPGCCLIGPGECPVCVDKILKIPHIMQGVT